MNKEEMRKALLGKTVAEVEYEKWFNDATSEFEIDVINDTTVIKFPCGTYLETDEIIPDAIYEYLEEEGGAWNNQMLINEERTVFKACEPFEMEE